MTLSKKKQVQAADDDNVYHIYRKKKVPDLLEKPRDFDPFGQAGLSPLATI